MTETFYKAVLPDGTDFYAGTVRWLPPVGESLPDDGLIVTHPTSRRKSTGGAAEYLPVATVPTDSTGMEWPCRLARVERTSAAVWTPDADLPYKRASWQWRVVEELDPTLALGPQGADVIALIDRAGSLTSEDAEAFDAALDAARDVRAAEDAAWDVARAAARDARDAAWDATQYAAWVAAQAGWAADWVAAQVGWHAAWDIARDAAIATLTRDLISESDYRLLAGPWLSVVGDTHDNE